MSESRSRSLPRWRSLDELVDYFDSHDMGDHFDQMREVEMEVHIRKKRFLVEVDRELLVRVAEIARNIRVSPEELIDSWLRERVFPANR